MKNKNVSPRSTTQKFLTTVWKQLGFYRRKQLCLALVLMLLTAAAELISLGSVIPFLAKISYPNKFWQKPVIQTR